MDFCAKNIDAFPVHFCSIMESWSWYGVPPPGQNTLDDRTLATSDNFLENALLVLANFPHQDRLDHILYYIFPEKIQSQFFL